MEKRGKDLVKLAEIMLLLASEKTINPKHRNHQLSGIYKGYWECHIENDWLLIYKLTKDAILFERTGTHSDLFR